MANSSLYGKDIRVLSDNSVRAEVWRDYGDYKISVQHKTFGHWFWTSRNNAIENGNAAHAWADGFIEELRRIETDTNDLEWLANHNKRAEWLAMKERITK